MAKKRSDVEAPDQIQDPFLNSSPEGEESTGIKRPKMGVFVPLTESGQLDSKRVKDPEKMEAARAALGASPSQPGAPEQKIDRSIVPTLVDGYAMVLQQATRLLKWPAEARAYIVFDKDAKERLTEPIGAMLDKVAPKLLAENQELAAFLLAIGIETNKVLQGALFQYSMQRATAVPEGAKPNGGVPVTQ